MARNISVTPTGSFVSLAVTTAATVVSTLGTVPTGAKSYKGSLEGNDIRARGDGTSPTASVGQLIVQGSEIIFDQSEFETMSLVTADTVAASIQGHFYGVEASVFQGAN